MLRRVRLVVAALVAALFAATPAAAQKTDIVVLQRGDRLTVEIDNLDRGRLVVKTDDLGIVYIEWDKVREVTSKAVFEIDDEASNRYLGSLGPGAEGQLTVHTSIGDIVLPLLSVVRIQRIGASFWQRLDGSVDIGASYASSSDLLKIDASASATYRRPRWESTLSGQSSITRQPDAAETRRNEGTFEYQRDLRWAHWLAFGQAQVSQNVELGYDLRTAGTGGAGRFLLRRSRDRLLAGGGLSVNREWPVDGDKRTNVEALGSIGYDFVTYDSPRTDVGASLTVLPSLSDAGRVRANIDVSLSRELVKDLFLKISFYERYDRRPPTEGAENHDYGTTLSFGWTF